MSIYVQTIATYIADDDTTGKRSELECLWWFVSLLSNHVNSEDAWSADGFAKAEHWQPYSDQRLVTSPPLKHDANSRTRRYLRQWTVLVTIFCLVKAHLRWVAAHLLTLCASQVQRTRQ